jgi:hypothetical protein
VVEPLASNRDRQQSGHTGGVCCRWGAFFFFTSFLISIRLMAWIVSIHIYPSSWKGWKSLMGTKPPASSVVR